MFDIQLFGDNDTVTSSNSLTLEYDIADDKTQKMTLSNGRTNLTAASIQNAMQADLENKIFVNKNDTNIVLSSDTATIGTAYRTDRTTRELDLT